MHIYYLYSTFPSTIKLGNELPNYAIESTTINGESSMEQMLPFVKGLLLVHCLLIKRTAKLCQAMHTLNYYK